MKFIYFIYLIIFLACNDRQEINDNSNQDKDLENNVSKSFSTNHDLSTDTTHLRTKNSNCSFADIFQLLENEHTLKSFFEQTNKWKEINDKKKEFLDDIIFVSLNKRTLTDFLISLKKAAKKAINDFEKDYEFNSFPTEFKSKRNCKDQIRLSFDEVECVYTIAVKNSFYVDDFGCSEHDVIYIFKINENQVKLIDITGAG